mgnify:CR=1 FL=1
MGVTLAAGLSLKWFRDNIADNYKAKAEELNHAKLQFFTNITHELLTPLTVISAAVDELKLSMPKGEDTYQVITNKDSQPLSEETKKKYKDNNELSEYDIHILF